MNDGLFVQRREAIGVGQDPLRTPLLRAAETSAQDNVRDFDITVAPAGWPHTGEKPRYRAEQFAQRLGGNGGLTADGRFTAIPRGPMISYARSESAVGGPIALLQVDLSDAELAARRADWSWPEPNYSKGVMAKYARQVSQASDGAVTGA